MTEEGQATLVFFVCVRAMRLGSCAESYIVKKCSAFFLFGWRERIGMGRGEAPKRKNPLVPRGSALGPLLHQQRGIQTAAHDEAAVCHALFARLGRGGEAG